MRWPLRSCTLPSQATGTPSICRMTLSGCSKPTAPDMGNTWRTTMPAAQQEGAVITPICSS